MSNLTNIQRKLSEGVTGWLIFEFYCFRGKIFSEKYLTYPIGQILNSITEYKTNVEVNHPKAVSRRGRPLQIDFVLKDNNDSWIYAIESKWVGDTPITIGSIVWDLIRIQNLYEYHSNLKSYFVLSGFQKKIKVLLETIPILYNGIKENNGFVDINSSYVTFNLKKADQTIKNYINKKINTYPEFKLYTKITCKPAHVFPKKDIVNMTFSTYVMEVLKPDVTTKSEKL